MLLLRPHHAPADRARLRGELAAAAGRQAGAREVERGTGAQSVRLGTGACSDVLVSVAQAFRLVYQTEQLDFCGLCDRSTCMGCPVGADDQPCKLSEAVRAALSLCACAVQLDRRLTARAAQLALGVQWAPEIADRMQAVSAADPLPPPPRPHAHPSLLLQRDR